MNEKTNFKYENEIGKIEFDFAKGEFWIEEIDSASSVTINVSESQSIGQIGSTVSAQVVKPKKFTLNGTIFDPISVNRKKLLEVIAPQVKSKFTLIENGESWYLDVVPTKTPIVESGNSLQKFQVELHAAFPYWKSAIEYNTQLTGLIPLFKFKFFTGGKWYISKFTDTFYYTIENKGNVPSEFVVVFMARSETSNPQLYQMDTGKIISINKTLLAGEKIIVSTVYGERGVTYVKSSGESENGFKYLNIESSLDMKLQPGENLLRTDASSNREGLDVRIITSEGVKSGV